MTTSVSQRADPGMRYELRPLSGGARLGLAWLDRPGQLNALNLDMCQSMLEQFRAWASDESVVCVLLAAAGAKGFCAGGDVAEVIRRVRAGGPDRFVYGDAFFEVEYQLDALLHHYPKPLVTWAHGIDMGGGVGLSVAGSERIVTPGLKLAMPEIHIGLFPDVGGGWFLNRMPGGTGRVLALTGAVIDEADAVYAGLADHVIAHERQAEFIDSLATLDWAGSRAGQRSRLRAHTTAFAAQPTGASDLAEPSRSRLYRYAACFQRLERPGEVALFQAELQKASAIDPWFERAGENLRAGSPTGARVTFEYLQRTRRMSLEEVLKLDLVVARQCQRHADFPEGVRALLIDKTRDPAWSPSSLEAVSDASVQRFFEPL